MTGKIYLEPREQFDTALVDIEENIYGYHETLDQDAFHDQDAFQD